MGRAKRIRPKYLGEKLQRIRTHMDCSLTEMANRLQTEEINLRRSDISKYERDINEPPLPVLLRYARISGTTMEVLVDDAQELPPKFL
jgi:transcriptional regulator with XRE-family HTH domain